MRLIITGAGGFLGQEIIRQLSNDNNYYVYALTSQTEQLKKKYIDNSHIVICQKDSLIQKSSILKDADILINCAFPRGTGGKQLADGLNYIKDSLEAAVENGIGAIINISSQSVYSQKRTTSATELSTVDLESSYAVGKYATELLTTTICAEIPFTNIRLASLIGPGFNQRVTNKLVDKALQDEKLTVMVGKQYFGFLDVEDAARGILKLVEQYPQMWKPIYNLGSENSYSLLDIAETIVYVFKNYFGKKITLETKLGESEGNTDLNSTLLKKDTGYEASISLKESILRIVQEKTKESI